MVKIWKIVNGEKKIIEVTRGAYDDIYKRQGFEIFNPENPAHEHRKEERNVPIVPTNCYVYAIDINTKKIVAALPCEGMIEANSACNTAKSELEKSKLEHGTLCFGVADLHRKARISIGLRRVVEIMYHNGKRPYPPIDVPVEDFEAAALHTADMLSRIQTLDVAPVEILFMQLAEAILPTITVTVLSPPYLTHNPYDIGRLSDTLALNTYTVDSSPTERKERREDIAASPPVPAVPEPAISGNRTPRSGVQAKVFEACKKAIENPRLTIKDLAALVGISKRTLDKHAEKINATRTSGIVPRETPAEYKRSNRKPKGSDKGNSE